MAQNKKIFNILLLSISFCFTLIGCNKNDKESELVVSDSIKYLKYNGDEKLAIIVGYEENIKDEVVIPSSIDGYKVNAIRHESFVGANIKKITIPESVFYIGYGSFAGCLNLKEILLPNSINTIYYNTFAECNSLESISIPNSVQKIGTGAFLGCDSLKSISFSNNLNDLGSYVFYNCPLLNNVDLTETKIETINEFCFALCSSLKEIKFNNITSISSGAFYECESLSSINLPDSLLIIGNNTFNSCTNLNNIFIPKNVIYIGENTFFNVNDNFKILLEAESLPDSFTDNFNCYYPYVLGANKNSKIEDVFISNGKLDYAINNYQSASANASIIYPNESYTGGDLSIPDTITYQQSKNAYISNIADYAFIENDKLTTLDLTNASKLNSIGKYSFAHSSLNSISFNTAIKNIETYCFAYCNDLTNIDLSNTDINSIGNCSFYYDYNLKTIKLPNTNKDTELGMGAFYKCRKLNSITNLDKISVINLYGYTFAECFNLGISGSPFIFTNNIKTLTTTDFQDWGTTQDQYIQIAKDAYTINGDGEVYLNANEGTIKLDNVSGSIYKNNLYFSDAIITLEAK